MSFPRRRGDVRKQGPGPELHGDAGGNDHWDNAFTMPKKFSVLGLPRVASMRCRLFEGFLIAAANIASRNLAALRAAA